MSDADTVTSSSEIPSTVPAQMREDLSLSNLLVKDDDEPAPKPKGRFITFYSSDLFGAKAFAKAAPAGITVMLRDTATFDGVLERPIDGVLFLGDVPESVARPIAEAYAAAGMNVAKLSPEQQNAAIANSKAPPPKDEFEVTKIGNNKWYVVIKGTDKVAAGPFDTKREATEHLPK